MGAFAYHSHGVPLESYELTKADHRSQATSDSIREAVAKMAASERAAEAADPQLAARRVEQVLQAWDITLKNRTPECDLMLWRVRLYCGHIAETRRHRTLERPTMGGSSSMRCPVCAKDPSDIVAYEPLGLLGGAVEVPPAPVVAPRLTRAQLEQRVKDLEAQLADARSDTTA